MNARKTCQSCREATTLDNFENRQANPDGKDELCRDCRKRWREEREQTPAGLYELRARTLTTLFKYRYFPTYNKTTHQLDHKFSIRKAYYRQVPLQVLCNRNNLQLLTTEANRRKGECCSISIDQLFKTVHNDPQLERAASVIATLPYHRLKELGQKYHERNKEIERRRL